MVAGGLDGEGAHLGGAMIRDVGPLPMVKGPAKVSSVAVEIPQYNRIRSEKKTAWKCRCGQAKPTRPCRTGAPIEKRKGQIAYRLREGQNWNIKIRTYMQHIWTKID